ncbi:hypothetical protein HIM_07042 [Hirsutella minnesotensis 3608]|uniref:Uncharacterized protein n=1 Tax=Hirsutella minnesotensis 3608 TaxID=1043627 RepID=A0A0F7ZI75_9HYPO|nr:hypothetical protein HIM_07042 [Hirsutella minnesotensis 3608]
MSLSLSPSPSPSPQPAIGPSALLASSTVPLPSSSKPAIFPPSFASLPHSIAPAKVLHSPARVFPPITTRWTKPQTCTWTYIADGQSQLASKGAIAWLDLEPNGQASCYPDGMFLDGRTGIFSPATCPGGWTTASLRVNTDLEGHEPTTTAICCSSNYSLDGSHCRRSVPTALAVPITYNRTAGTYDVLSSSTTTLYSAIVAVHTIRALFMEQDKALLGLTDGEEISEDDLHQETTLPLGSRIGIALGVAVFAIMCIGFIAFGALRWRSSRQRQAKRRSLHELGILYGGQFHRRDRSDLHGHYCPEPPPAYEATRTMGRVNEDQPETAVGRQDEMRVLIAQKAAIQSRIDALERICAECSQDVGHSG